MAGGIFVDQPFYLNIKCIIFGVVLSVGYWFIADKKSRNPFVIVLIMVFAYIAMAWYDYFYNCDQQMYSGTGYGVMSILDTWGKPQRRQIKSSIPPAGVNLIKNQEAAYQRSIYLLHSIFLLPFLIYVAYHGNKLTDAITINKEIYPLLEPLTRPKVWQPLFWIAIFGEIYHVSRVFYPRETETCLD